MINLKGNDMKIRSGYVSNSSSSSFVVTDFDKDKILPLVPKFVENIDFNDEYNKYYTVKKEDIISCIIDKIESEGSEQESYLKTYVKDDICNIFCQWIEYFIKKREQESSECSNCEDKGDCKGCYWDYLKNTIKHMEEEIELDCQNYPQLNLEKEKIKLKNLVYDSEVTNDKNGNIRVVSNWSDWYEVLDIITLRYFEEWKTLNPNAYVLSFASDEGNVNEAFVRNNIVDFCHFMLINGINGFNGEDS